MANLINTIPVYKPQTQMTQPQQSVSVQKPLPTSSVSNPFPQVNTYSYIPAKPLSPARTTPKGVRPHAASGHLVKENIFQSMGSTVKSYADYVKYFYKAAFKGEGTDYSVGKINDLAIRTGSLGIATVLATSKVFPFAKGMEFVGLGTWFASMALWPQVLGAPIKAKTGVDINQKYIDSYGRRKFVYEDNLYRPMDLYRHVDLNGKPLSEEEYYKKYDVDYVYLDAVGDKLGIPRDIKNRHEAIMNKMGQVAVQGKTLWMMTAGVMTPVVSSIIADSLQEPLKNGLEKYRYNKQLKEVQELDKKLDSLLDINQPDLGKRRVNTNIEEVIKALDIKIPESSEKEFKSLMGETGTLSKSDFDKLQKFIENRFFGTGLKEPMDCVMHWNMRVTEPKIRLNDNLRDGLMKATSDAVKEVLGGLKKEFVATLPKEITEYKGISQQEYWDIISHSYNDGAQEMGQVAHSAFQNMAQRIPMNRFKQLKGVDEEVIELISDAIDKKVIEYMDSQRHYILPQEKLTQLFRFAELNNQLKQKLAKFEETSIMNISEAITANNWNKVPDKYLKALGFSKAELAQLAAADSSVSSKALAKKLEEVVADPEKYKKVLSTMSKYAKEAISKEEKAVIQLIGTVETPGTLSKVKDLMTAMGGANFGDTMSGPLTNHYRAEIFDLQNKMRNTVDSFVRPIKALDTFKNIDAEIVKILGGNANEYNAKLSNIEYYMFKGMDYETAKKALKAYIKDIALDKNDINNWTTKAEHVLPGGKNGIKDSLGMVQRVIGFVNGRLQPETENIIIDSFVNISEADAAKDTAKQAERFAQRKAAEAFVHKCDANNEIMRSRFLRLINKLTVSLPENRNYMLDEFPLKMFTEELLSGNNKYLDVLDILIDERKSELSLDKISDLKRARQALRESKMAEFGHDNIRKIFKDLLTFDTSNKSISEMTGKNVTEFFIGAAENARSRNKWSKLAYGLLIGTVALSGVVIAMMGKKNYFNKDIYEKKESVQGAVK